MTYQERRDSWVAFWAGAYATGNNEEIRFLNSAFNETEYDRARLAKAQLNY